MERKIYVVQSYDTGVEKLVKLTVEQAKAIAWLIDTFDIPDIDINNLDEITDIDAP